MGRSCWLRVTPPHLPPVHISFQTMRQFSLKSSVLHLYICTLVDRRLRERRGPPDQRHRGVRSASAAAAGAAADSAAARLPDAAHQTADHQPGGRSSFTRRTLELAYDLSSDPHMILILISYFLLIYCF